jgi:hypothetical protein
VLKIVGWNKVEINMEDDLIYHYSKASVALNVILPTMKLRLSSLRRLNDPREYKELRFSLQNASQNPLDYYKIDKRANLLIKNRFRVICFCESRYITRGTRTITRKGSSRARMWSQYGDNHKGVCLAFSKRKIDEQLKQTLDQDKLFTGKVKYKGCTHLDNNILRLDYREYIKAKNNYLFKHVSNHYKELFFIKNVDYRDENEYRIIYFENKPGDFFIDIRSSIKGIILGDNFCKKNKDYLPTVEKFVKENNLFCERVCWENGDSYTYPVDF